jgi:hypothetical protein
MRYSWLGSVWTALLLGAFAPPGCGSEADEAPSSSIGGSGAGGGGGAGAGGAGAGSGGSGAVLIDSGSDAVDPDAGCGFYQEKAKSTPLHLYVMMDKSSSMDGGKWTAAKAGIGAFVNDPASTGISVGLGFFPRDADGTPACEQDPYKTPKVAFDTLPSNAGPIVQALDAEQPTGMSTPIYPALGGAILAGIQIASNNPGHTAAVLLVTDGEPEGPAPLCAGVNPEDFQAIASLAASGAGFNPPVLTYVIGLPGVNQSFANTVAQAGGTSSAILVSNTNVQVEFQKALEKVRGQALPCELEIPEEVKKGEVAYGLVNVILTKAGKAEALPRSDDCDPAGWYYAPPATPGADPTTIILCPSVCDGIKNDFSAVIEIQLGCVTYIPA